MQEAERYLGAGMSASRSKVPISYQPSPIQFRNSDDWAGGAGRRLGTHSRFMRGVGIGAHRPTVARLRTDSQVFRLKNRSWPR